MENKAKIQKLLLEQQEDLKKIIALEIPHFDAGRELGTLIKGDPDLSDSQTFLNVKKYGTNMANYLKSAKTSATKGLQAVEEALARVGK